MWLIKRLTILLFALSMLFVSACNRGYGCPTGDEEGAMSKKRYKTKSGLFDKKTSKRMGLKDRRFTP